MIYLYDLYYHQLVVNRVKETHWIRDAAKVLNPKLKRKGSSILHLASQKQHYVCNIYFNNV